VFFGILGAGRHGLICFSIELDIATAALGWGTNIHIQKTEHFRVYPPPMYREARTQNALLLRF
jgi:hypothetical protein